MGDMHPPPAKRLRPGYFNVPQLASAAGATKATIRALVAQGVITPDERGFYSNGDLRTVLAALGGAGS